MTTPDSPWEADHLPMQFYRPESLALHEVDAPGLDEMVRPRFLLVTPSFDDTPSRLRAYSCTPLYTSLPSWTRRLTWAGIDRVPAWDLSRCVRREGQSHESTADF